MKTILTGLLGSAVLLTSISTLHAEQQDAVIVTATRTAQTVDESLASVTVLTEADIQRSQANNIEELLQGYAGIDIRSNGGVGKTTSLFMRGTSSNHVLVMIDGIKIGSATNGDASLQNIPVSQIERIEIVRGPRSSLYGSDAIGGVIQIFTKKSRAKTIANFNTGYGSNATSQLSAGVSGGSDAARYRIQASQYQTDGINAKQNGNPDKDGYDNSSVIANFSYNFNPKTELLFNILHAEGNNEYDGFTNTNLYQSEFVQQTAGMTLKLAPSNNWQMNLQVAQSRDESDNYTNSVFGSRFNTQKKQASWQNNFTLNAQNLFTVGLDYQQDKVASTTEYDEKSRDNTGVFVQHQWNGESNDLIIALRQDDNQAFGKHTTGNIAYGHQFNNTYRTVVSYGTAFNAPTFNQLYWPFFGNPDLKPEKSETVELALKAKPTWGYWDISLYQTKIKDGIPVWPPANVDEMEINGVEFRIGGRFAGLKHQLDLDYIDPRDKKTNNILPRRSRETLRYAIDETQGVWQYGAVLIVKSASYDDADNTTRVDGYNLVNIHSSYAVNKKWSLRAKVDNLFDEDYETIDGYNTAGINAFVSINYQGF